MKTLPGAKELVEKYAAFVFGSIVGVPDDVIRQHFSEFAEEIASLIRRTPQAGELVAALCPSCAGSGRNPNAPSWQCPKCRGTGAVVIK